MPIDTPPLTPNWQAIFRKNSWWFDPATKRHFVIVSRTFKNATEIETIDLLEEKKEWPETLKLEQMIKFFNKALLVTESVMGEFADMEVHL